MPTTRKITTAPKAVKTAVAKAATAARAVIAKPVATVAPVIADTAVIAPVVTPAAPAVAKPSGSITRTAATVAAQRTNYGSLSERDSAYLRFYSRLAKASVTGTVTLAGIVATGERPNYIGSNKPHDAGVIVRLVKAGLLAHNDGGHGFTVTDLGKSHREYAAG